MPSLLHLALASPCLSRWRALGGVQGISVNPASRFVRPAPTVGQTLTVDLFKPGELVDVVGVTKGQGFQGGVKRHGFRGGADTHGSMFHRAPGSIGASSYPSRVFPGQHLPGHMGTDRVTVKNLAVVGVDQERGLLLVKGAVPGSPRGIVLITAKR